MSWSRALGDRVTVDRPLCLPGELRGTHSPRTAGVSLRCVVRLGLGIGTGDRLGLGLWPKLVASEIQRYILAIPNNRTGCFSETRD